MSTRAEHYREAERLIATVTPIPEWELVDLVYATLRLAQVHATLATASEDTQQAAWRIGHPPKTSEVCRVCKVKPAGIGLDVCATCTGD